MFEKKRHIYGFDSFEGFPEPGKQDTPQKSGLNKGQYATTEDEVKRYLVNSGVSLDFISDRITFVKGFFNETLITYSGIGIALLHLDVALYQSYKDCLETLYSKVVKGGIIAFDEYRETEFNGATKAIDEFIEGKETIIKSSIIDRHYLVKSI